MIHVRTTIVLLAALLVAAACIPMTVEEGSGTPASETREFDEFAQVELVGSLDISVSPGDRHEVSISGDDNLVEQLVTEVEGGRLTVREPRNTIFEPKLPLKIVVHSPTLRQVDLVGSGDVRIHDVRRDELTATVAGSGGIRLEGKWERLRTEIAGSGDIRATGQAKKFRAEVAGSGDIHARELRTLRARAEVAGSGDIRVCAEESLHVEVVGSGDVHSYCETSSVETNIAGSGDFRQR